MAIDWYKRGLIKYESLVSSGISIGNGINGNQVDDVQVDNVEIDFHFTKIIKTYSWCLNCMPRKVFLISLIKFD